MPQQPFILRVHFYLPEGTGRRGLGSAGHHVDYMGDAAKHELLVDDDRTTVESAAVHAQYAGERAGTMGYMGDMAHDPQAAQASIRAAQGPVWRVIASVGEADALAMGGELTTKAGWERAAQAVMPIMIQQLGLDPAKVRWIAAAHRYQTHEHNPHIHLLFWEEGSPTRKTAQWSDADRRAIRRAWVSELYRPEREQVGQVKAAARTEARTLVMHLLAQRNGLQGFQQELTERLRALGRQLPGRGRLAYAYLPPEVKHATEELIRWLWAHDPGVKSAYERYMEAAIRMGTFYWHQSPDHTQDSAGRQAALERIRRRAEADLIRRLAGPVLRAARATVTTPPGARLRPTALTAALTRLTHHAEREARATAAYLAAAQWRRQAAEQQIARTLGVHLAY
jgi:hypothetical protein